MTKPITYPADSLPIEHYAPAELVVLRDRCNKLLPNINKMDLSQELVLQFVTTKQMLQDANEASYDEDDNTPLNQKIQAVNSLTAILKQLSEVQIKLYSAERTRAIEQALIKVMKDPSVPDDIRTAFFESYEAELALIR